MLYFFGVALRQAQAVKNKYIPLILGGISMVLCAVWVMATSEIETAKEGAMAVFTAVTQGILVAGLSNYVNQIIKQIHKPENGASKNLCYVGAVGTVRKGRI